MAAAARNPERLRDLHDKYGDAVVLLRLDVTDYDAAARVVTHAAQTCGRTLDRLAKRLHARHLDPLDEPRLLDGGRGDHDAPQAAPGERGDHRQDARHGRTSPPSDSSPMSATPPGPGPDLLRAEQDARWPSRGRATRRPCAGPPARG